MEAEISKEPLVSTGTLDDEEARIDKLIEDEPVQPVNRKAGNQSSFMLSMESAEPNKRSSAVLSRSFMS